MPNTTYRLDVLIALTELLEGIVPTAPTISPTLPTLTGRVFRGRARFGDNDPDTMISILEAPRPGGAIYGGDFEARAEDWQLLIQGWCPDDKGHPSDPVYYLADDVEKRLERISAITNGTGYPKYPEHYMLGNRITKFQQGSPVIRPPTENVSSKSFFYLPVQVGLARISRE